MSAGASDAPPGIDYERLYREVSPSVVSLYRDGRGAGSGFVYDDRHVVTNEHVVRGSDEVSIRSTDGRWHDGRVVGRDEYTDLAVVRMADLPEGATALPVADENPAPGRAVAALGNPFGLEGSISAGIVSGSSRSMPTAAGFSIPDVVQTDAAINPGNSGGPLVGVAGEGGYEVVGVNRARSGDNVGFAISPAIVGRVVPALVDRGQYRHSYLRVRTLDVGPTIAEANGLDRTRGVLVVDAGEAAAGDGLRGSPFTRTIRGREIPVGGDVVVGIDGQRLRSHEQLTRYLITETDPGDVVEVEILRDGKRTSVSLVLGERPRPGRGSRDGGTPVPVR